MAKTRKPVIALLTDFGINSLYPACMKAVMLNKCPSVTIIDITHEISKHNINEAAFLILQAYKWFPLGTVFACVVDPGVGTSRNIIAAKADDHIFVTPDNGLCSLIFKKADNLSMVKLSNKKYWLKKTSTTFHGRDIIAPVCSAIANGLDLRGLGSPLRSYQSLAIPKIRQASEKIEGHILLIDSFGNMITNISYDLLKRNKINRIVYKRKKARIVLTYSQGKKGELIAICSSSGYLELATKNESAAKLFNAKPTDAVYCLKN